MDENKFRWEETFQKTWDGERAEEESTGMHVSRRTENVQRGIVRKVLLVLDMSSSVEERDFLPTRKHHLKSSVRTFYRTFTESNPLSTIGVAVVSDGLAHLASVIVSDEEILDTIISKAPGSGRFSLEAALETAAVFFQNSSFLKEIVIVASSISFTGRSPYKVINNLIGKGVKIHTVHLAAEMNILKELSTRSGGIFGVTERPEDLPILLDLINIPTPHNTSGRLSMLEVGFPKAIEEASICACHLKMTERGYVCPFCSTKVCSIPGVCPICESILSAAVHLLKAFHWMDSAPIYLHSEAAACAACQAINAPMQMCPKCKTSVCIECSTFIHQELNFCIFCSDAS
ncbi:transcription initiation factor TFIIH subunit 2 [Nematocida displodere]|uniref:Transcription initiation factor TFIIH subunit 2 n=1 Tax=Nematocida displodere TaxID=1805483 RepID=A0A177EII5_9MICR|nr:transcription initiation factor TFIIH subunit 2 [Nematocida displodere]